MTYVISDIHGNYEKFQSILSQIGFSDRDVMYVLGDVVDFGEGAMELIADLSVRVNVYPVAGEHDFLAARMLKSGSAPDADYIAEMTAWVQDGGQATLDAFRALSEDEREGVLEYLEEMTLFEEAEIGGERYVMAHAGIADYTPNTDLDDCHPKAFFSKPLDTAKSILKLFGLTKYFDFVGGATSHQNDQKWQVLNWSLSSVGVDLNNPDDLAKCVLVGDRKYDAEGAKICGIDSFGVLYGHGTKEELEASGFTALVETVSDISKMLI